MKFSDVLSQVIDLAKKANAARAQRAFATGGFPAVTSGAQAQGIQVLGSSGPVTVSPGLPGSASPGTAPSGQPIMFLPLPEENTLRQFLETQSPQSVYMLTAVMYLGRGDFDVGKLLENNALMGERFGDPKGAAKQMAEKISLPQYLEEGRKKVDQAKIDLDQMVSTQAA